MPVKSMEPVLVEKELVLVEPEGFDGEEDSDISDEDEASGTKDDGVSDDITEYELAVVRQREQNKATLQQLMADKPVLLASPKKSTAGSTRKRKVREVVVPTRRSSRVMKRVPVSPNSSESGATPEPTLVKDASPAPEKKLRVDGKRFGPIPGVDIGDQWEMRIALGAAGVHPPPVAGIFGGAESGAYSVVLSAGYPEDVDHGDRFTYTGSGGRELAKKNLRTSHQSSNQQLVRGNAGLAKSFETGNPVRVTRGFKNPLGPVTGYRYDGLYKIVKVYTSLNHTGNFLVWQFDFVRLPGQKPVNYRAKSMIKDENGENTGNVNGPLSPPASDEEDVQPTKDRCEKGL